MKDKKDKEPKLTAAQKKAERIAGGFGPGQARLYNELKDKSMDWYVAMTLVRYYPRHRIEEALEERDKNRYFNIYDHVTAFSHKQEFAEDRDVYDLYTKLQGRYLQEPAILSIIYLYPTETVKKVLDERPKLDTIEFVTKLQTFDKKPEVIHKNEEFEKHVRASIRREKARMGGAEISVIEADPAEAEYFDNGVIPF